MSSGCLKKLGNTDEFDGSVLASLVFQGNAATLIVQSVLGYGPVVTEMTKANQDVLCNGIIFGAQNVTIVWHYVAVIHITGPILYCSAQPLST